MTDTKKIPLVLFSGGLDSTALLLDSLKNSDVDTLYVASLQGEAKITKEHGARQAIFKMIKDHDLGYGNSVLTDYVFKLDYELHTNTYDDDVGSVTRKLNMFDRPGFSQPQLWLFAALQTIDKERHSEVRMAYVTGDQIVYHLRELEAAWNHLQCLTGSTIRLTFPLVYWKKELLLKKIGPVLEALIWTCELPTGEGKPCGNCAACISLAKAKLARDIMNRPAPIINSDEFEKKDDDVQEVQA